MKDGNYIVLKRLGERRTVLEKFALRVARIPGVVRVSIRHGSPFHAIKLIFWCGGKHASMVWKVGALFMNIATREELDAQIAKFKTELAIYRSTHRYERCG